jgi:hypothetical protein
MAEASSEAGRSEPELERVLLFPEWGTAAKAVTLIPRDSNNAETNLIIQSSFFDSVV